MTEIEGVVKLVKKDKKGLQLENGEWYSNNFLKNPLICNRGDKVKVFLNGKGFLELVEVLEKGLDKPTQDRPEFKQQARESINASQLTSYAKDLVIAGKSPDMETAIKSVVSAYKTAIKELESELHVKEEKI